MTRVDGSTSRRAFLGMAAAGVAGAVSACGGIARSIGAGHPVAETARPWRAKTVAIAENSRPGTEDWVIHHLGAADEIMGYAGTASVAQGERFPLYVSTTADEFRVNAYRLGWYQGHGAREGWS